MQQALASLPWASCMVLTALLAAGGCQPAPAMADAARARDALHAALEAWKRGDSPETLKKQPGPIYCNDDDWAARMRLRSYKIADQNDYYGRSCRILAQIELENGRGTPVQKKLTYLIDTASAVVIVRDR